VQKVEKWKFSVELFLLIALKSQLMVQLDFDNEWLD